MTTPDRCAHCGAPRHEHLSIVAGGLDAALCPTALFATERTPTEHERAVGRLLFAKAQTKEPEEP